MSGSYEGCKQGGLQLVSAFSLSYRHNRNGSRNDPSPPQLAKGFTLLELLVVILIAGLLVSLAVLNVGLGGREQRLREEAERVWQLMRLAADEAVLYSRQYGIRFDTSSYRFYELQETDGKWLPLAADPRLRDRRFPEGVEAEIEVEGTRVVLDDIDSAEKPQIFFLSSGEMMPEFAVLIWDREIDSGYRIAPGNEIDLLLEVDKS